MQSDVWWSEDQGYGWSEREPAVIRCCKHWRERCLADRLLVQERCARAYTDAVFQTLDHAYRSMSENKEQIESDKSYCTDLAVNYLSKYYEECYNNNETLMIVGHGRMPDFFSSLITPWNTENVKSVVKNSLYNSSSIMIVWKYSSMLCFSGFHGSSFPIK